MCVHAHVHVCSLHVHIHCTYPAIEDGTFPVHVCVLHFSEQACWIIACGGLQEPPKLESSLRAVWMWRGRGERSCVIKVNT